MRIRDIFFTNAKRAILLRGTILVVFGLLVAGVVYIFTGENITRGFAFAIFGVPSMLTAINLLAYYGERRDGDG